MEHAGVEPELRTLRCEGSAVRIEPVVAGARVDHCGRVEGDEGRALRLEPGEVLRGAERVEGGMRHASLPINRRSLGR